MSTATAGPPALALSLWIALRHLAPALFETLSAFLVSAFLVLCCIPALHEGIRAALRPWVVYHVEEGLVWVRRAQAFETPLLTKVFQWSSTTVSVSFYVRGGRGRLGNWARTGQAWRLQVQGWPRALPWPADPASPAPAPAIGTGTP